MKRVFRALGCALPVVLALARVARADEPDQAVEPEPTDAPEKPATPEAKPTAPAAPEAKPAAPATPEAKPTAPATPRPVPDEKPPLGLFSTPEDAMIDPRMMLSWSTKPSRYFVATTTDVGFVYLRPRVTVGYGRPFTSFVGLDANPLAQTTALGAYGGLRLQIPHFDLRVGTRFLSAFTHTYLESKPSYQRIELETAGGKKATTLTHELELDGSIPLGPGEVLLRGSFSYVTGVPSGMSVFEETLHVIVKPPLVWRARGGYSIAFGARRQHSIGLVCDVLDVPKREDSVTVRVGPVIRLVLSRRVELRGSFVMTVTSPDTIGLVGGDFTDLGVRYRWATE